MQHDRLNKNGNYTHHLLQVKELDINHTYIMQCFIQSHSCLLVTVTSRQHCRCFIPQAVNTV